MVVAKGRGPWRFCGGLFLCLGNCLCLWDHAVFFFLGLPQGCWQRNHVDSFLSFLSLAFSPPENTGFIWILDVGFCESWILDVESWILDLGFL